MVVVCPKCCADNQPTARFCTVCGTDLSGIAPSQSQRSLSLNPSGMMPLPMPPSGVTPSGVTPPATTLMQGPPPGSRLPAARASLRMADGTNLDLEQSTVIGRDASQCSLALPNDTMLSRRHARIQESGGVWTLEDLNSSNGCYVNLQRVQGVVALKPGDQIGLGSATYIFVLAGMSNPPVPAGPLSPPPVQTPSPLGNPFPGIGPVPVTQAPPGGWRAWTKQPTAEGYVRRISERYMMKKDDLLKRGLMAAALAIFITPALAFLPMMQGNEIAARDMRVEDHLTGRMVDVQILGDMLGSISQGDAVSVWGQVESGLLILEAAYNYATDTDIRIRKK